MEIPTAPVREPRRLHVVQGPLANADLGQDLDAQIRNNILRWREAEKYARSGKKLADDARKRRIKREQRARMARARNAKYRRRAFRDAFGYSERSATSATSTTPT